LEVKYDEEDFSHRSRLRLSGRIAAGIDPAHLLNIAIFVPLRT